MSSSNKTITKKKFSRLDDYVLVKTLGSGYNSKVKLAFHKKENKYYAAKIIRNKVHVNSNIKALKNEIAILTKLSHPNILNIKEYNEDGVYTKKNGKSYKTKYVILDLANSGELFGYVAYVGRFEEKIARYYFHQLIDAVDYCHRNGITHRDLKPENLLLDDEFNLKISDFGFSTNIDRSLTSHVGTKLYMAPEMHMPDMAYNGPAVDIFACGLILFTMYTGLQPYETAAHPKDSFYKYFFTNNSQEYWQIVKSYMAKKVDLNEDFKGLISAMLAVDPVQRPSMAEIKEHPWYTGPVATSVEAFKDLSQRKVKVEQEVEKQRLQKELEKKKEEKEEHLSKKNVATLLTEAPCQGAKAFRGPEEKEKKEELTEINAEVEDLDFQIPASLMEVKNYGLCDIATRMSADKVMSILETLNSKNFTETKKNENGNKFKCLLVCENENLEMMEKINEIEEGVNMVEFKRVSGSIKKFYEIAMKLKEALEKHLD